MRTIDKPIDKSRERSLYFLILVTLRKYVSQSEDVPSARELAKNLTIIEAENVWEITTLLNKEKISTTVPKENFRFYPTKDRSSYDIEPSQQNAASAKSVVQTLFNSAGIANSQFPVNNNVNIKSRKFLTDRIELFQVPIVFFLSLITYLNLISDSISPSSRVIFGLYVFILFIGKRNIQKNFSKFIPLIIAFGILSYFSRINLGLDYQVIFTGQLLLVEILNRTRTNSIRRLYLFIISACALIILSVINSNNFPRGQIGMIFISLSLFFLNSSKTLQTKSKFRQFCLIIGASFFGLGIVLMLSFSVNSIFAFMFIMLIAVIMQLTSSGQASTKIYLGVGWVLAI